MYSNIIPKSHSFHMYRNKHLNIELNDDFLQQNGRFHVERTFQKNDFLFVFIFHISILTNLHFIFANVIRKLPLKTFFLHFSSKISLMMVARPS